MHSAFAPMHLSQSGSRSDMRLEGRGIETRDAQRTLWSHSHGTVAQCTRKHTASESHKVPLEEGGSPRPRAFLLSERDPLCRRGSRVNFMKLTLLPRQCIYRIADRVPTRGTQNERRTTHDGAEPVDSLLLAQRL